MRISFFNIQLCRLSILINIATVIVMERKILDIKLKDKIKITTIKRISETKRISEIITEQKWRWTGYILRQNIEKWSN